MLNIFDAWSISNMKLGVIFFKKSDISLCYTFLGYSTCTLINKFKIHNSYDAGIYYQGGGSVIISDVLITDSGIAIIPLIFGYAVVLYCAVIFVPD